MSEPGETRGGNPEGNPEAFLGNPEAFLVVPPS